jgi:hypothetical protein
MRSLLFFLSITLALPSDGANINREFTALYETFSRLSQIYLEHHDDLRKEDIEQYFDAKSKLIEYYDRNIGRMNSAELWLYHNVIDKMKGKDDKNCDQLILWDPLAPPPEEKP